MIDLTDARIVRGIHSNINATFNTPQGKETMEFLQEACGWYESILDTENEFKTIINAGRREVIATIMTFLNHSPEQIVAMAKQKGEGNG